jgi:hypothetical protein
VKWNAAFALAREQLPEANAIIGEVLQGAAKFSENPGAGLTPEALNLYQNAFRAALQTGDADLRRKVEHIADSHTDLKVRQAAKESLIK